MKFKRIVSIFFIACFMCTLGFFCMGNDTVAYAYTSGQPSIEHYSYSIDMFWEYLDKRMHRCEPGEKVIAAAEARTSMPAYIFESIKETGTILEIQWNEGETFVIEEVPEYDEKIVSFYFTEIIEMLAAEKE